MVSKICLECGKEFKVFPYRFLTAKYCSNACNCKVNISGWNKGKNIQTNTGRTHFGKGHIAWNSGLTYGLSKQEKMKRMNTRRRSWRNYDFLKNILGCDFCGISKNLDFHHYDYANSDWFSIFCHEHHNQLERWSISIP